MNKKALCIPAALLCAVLMFSTVLCFAACSGRGAQPVPTSSVPQVTPDPDGATNETVPAKEGAGAALAEAADTVLIRFTGLAEAEVTAKDIAEMDLYEYTETTLSDTPVFCGPLVRDVLAGIGASQAKTLKIMLGGGKADRSFGIAELNLDTAMFAVMKDGALSGEGRCTLICVTLDGFSYMLDADSAIVLE